MTILEDVRAAQESVVKGDACKKQNAARKAQCAGRALCAWIPGDKKGTKKYVWFVPEGHKTDRRKAVEARWAKRKRERAVARA